MALLETFAGLVGIDPLSPKQQAEALTLEGFSGDVLRFLYGVGALDLSGGEAFLAAEKARREEFLRLARAARLQQKLFNASILGPASVFSVLSQRLT